MTRLSPAESIILAIDTSSEGEAERLAQVAQAAGARFIKLGLELSSATSWAYCSDLAQEYNLDWVADAKLDDIPNTVSKTVRNIAGQPHPPFGITMHTKAGINAMQSAQDQAGDIIIFGVTELTSIPYSETYHRYKIHRSVLVAALALEAAEAGLKGIVASPKEVAAIKSDEPTSQLFAMIPGTRSPGTKSHDQANVDTPAKAIEDGADLLVIGRQITQAENPASAYRQLVREIS